MCFTNNKPELDKLRARKTPMRVWKTGDINDKTGLIETSFTSDSDRVVWQQGKVVVPTRRRKPLGPRGVASVGLYFYTSKLPKTGYKNASGAPLSYGEPFVVATVKPEDIIAVDHDGLTICCVKAKVVKAPNPDQKAMRIKWLKRQAKLAKSYISDEEVRMKGWLEKRDEREEALRAITDELKELKE